MSKKTDKSIDTTIPTTAEGWRELAARALRDNESIVKAIDTATIKQRREAARVAQARAGAYAKVGVHFDRDGIGRWSNGQPVIGGRRPRR